MRWFVQSSLLGLYIDFHLFVQLNPNRKFNPKLFTWKSSPWHLMKTLSKKINTGCLQLPLFNTDDADILIFPAI